MILHSECVFIDEGKYFNQIDIEVNQFPRMNGTDMISIEIREYCDVTCQNKIISTVLTKERVRLIIQGLQSIVDAD